MRKLGNGKVCECLRMCSDGLEKSSLGEASSLAICSHELVAMICDKLVREIAMSVLTAFHGGRTHASLPQRSDRLEIPADARQFRPTLIQLAWDWIELIQLATCSEPALRTRHAQNLPKRHCSVEPVPEGWRSGWRGNSGHISTRYLLVVFFASGIEQSEVIAALTSQLAPLGRDKVRHINENHRLRFEIRQAFVIFAICPWIRQDLDPIANSQQCGNVHMAWECVRLVFGTDSR